MNLFYNNHERRFRAGWRLLFQFILMFAGTIVFLLPISALWPEPGTAPFSLRIILPTFAGTLLSVWFAGRYLDLRPFRAFGQSPDRNNLRELGWGLLLGLAGMVMIFGMEWLAGWTTVTGFGWERVSAGVWLGRMVEFLLAMILVGYYEELMYRGYQIINIGEGLLGSRIDRWQAIAAAIAISSLVFGIMHAGNPNASGISTVNIMVAGVLFAIPFVLTGRLGIPVGIHISWNFCQAGIFGFPVSGMPMRASLLQTSQEGPAWITGGAFGPEAGILGLLGMAMIMVLFFLLYRFTSQVRAPVPLIRQTEGGFSETDEQGS